jgi:hypothetical protein
VREGKNNHKFALAADKRQQRPHNRICVKNAKQAKFCFEMVTERDKEIEGQMGQREKQKDNGMRWKTWRERR